MRFKPKTVRRLLLLTLVLAMCAGAAVAVFFVRNARNQARLETRRTDGLQAVAAGDYPRALDHLGGYLRRRPGDADVLLAYARARRNVEDREGRHLTEAAGAYHRYLGLRDTDQVARRELLQCYADAGMDPEACDVARRLRPEDPAALTPDHLDVLRLELAARQGKRDFGDATIALARRSIELAPNDFGLRLRLASLLAGAQRPGESEARSEDTLLHLAKVAGLDPDTGARTGPPLDDSEIVLAMLIAGFDAFARPDLVLAVLEPRAGNGEAIYVQAFARRALYSAQYTRLIALQSTCSSKPAWNAPDVLAVVALALAASGKRDESDAVFARFATLTPDYRTRSWSMVRDTMLQEGKVQSPETIKILRNAIIENPVEPIFRARLAEVLLQFGRTDEARTELAAAERSPLCDGWARPGVLRARSYLLEDRLVEARKASLETVRRCGSDVAALAMLLAVRSEMLDRGMTNAAEVKSVAEGLPAAFEKLIGPDGRSAPREIRSTLTAAIVIAADKVGNVELSREAMLVADDSAAMFSVQSLSRLVEISRRRGFGQEEALLKSAESDGPTPASTMVRAILLNSESKTAEAIEMLRRETGTGERAADNEWCVLLPCYLDVINHPDANGEWKAALARNPDDVQVHMIAIQSRSVSRDADLVAKVADRLDTLSGSKGAKAWMMVRLARARALAASPDAAKNPDQLIGALRAIVADAPDLLEPRLLLADALAADSAQAGATSKYAEAVEQLRAALPLSSDPSAIRLRIAEIHRRSGNMDAARTEFDAIGVEPGATTASRLAAVDGLAALGRFEEAANMARPLVPTAGATELPPRAIMLARIMNLAGRDDDALRIYADLSRRDGDLSAEQAFEVASALVTLGRANDAHSMLDRLAADPSRRHDMSRAKAQLLLTSGQIQEARSILVRLVDSDSKDSHAWRLLVESYVSEGNLPEAQRAIERARAGRDQDPGLELLALQLEFRSGKGSVDSLAALADVLEKTPGLRERADAVRAYAAARADGKPVDPALLRDLASRFQDEPTLQAVIINDLLSASPPALATASEISQETARRFPAQWQAAADVVRVHRITGEWNIVVDAALRWKRLTRSFEADLALAEAYLELGHLRQARAAVEPHFAGARQRPDESVGVILLWGRILLADRNVDEVSRTLDPMMQKSAVILSNVWLPLAGNVVPVEQAPTWIDAADRRAATFGGDAPGNVAGAWFTLAARDPKRRAEHMAKSRGILEELAAKSSDPRALIMLGEVAGEMGDLDRAQSAFQAAAGNPLTKSEALRGMAQVALDRRGNPDAAIAAARAAVDASDSKSPGSLRILADSLVSGAEAESDSARSRALAKEAASMYAKALGLTGEDPVILDRLALAYEKAHQPEDVIRTYERLLLLPPALLTPQNRAATQNNLAYAISTTRPDKESLEKARDLARSAAENNPVGAILDTLGSIEASLGNRAGAIDAFRRSLEDRPESLGTTSRLAELLAAGTLAEKEEAKRLILLADESAQETPSDMTSDIRDRLRRVRDSLGMP